jgi:hypothetical protein
MIRRGRKFNEFWQKLKNIGIPQVKGVNFIVLKKISPNLFQKKKHRYKAMKLMKPKNTF